MDHSGLIIASSYFNIEQHFEFYFEIWSATLHPRSTLMDLCENYVCNHSRHIPKGESWPQRSISSLYTDIFHISSICVEIVKYKKSQ